MTRTEAAKASQQRKLGRTGWIDLQGGNEDAAETLGCRQQWGSLCRGKREARWGNCIDRNRARTGLREGNYWRVDSHRSLVLLAQENCLAQALWYMDHMDLIAGMEHLSSLCQKLQHSSTGGCPKIAWHCTVGTPWKEQGMINSKLRLF